MLVPYTSRCETLLLKRNWHHTFWQSVTGSIGWHGESPAQAAVRELFEETSIVAQLGDIRDLDRQFRFRIPMRYRHRYQPEVQWNIEHVFCLCLERTVPIELQADEHHDYRWVSLGEAVNAVWSWSNREAIEMVRRAL